MKSVAVAILFPARYFAFLTARPACSAAAIYLRGSWDSSVDVKERAA